MNPHSRLVAIDPPCAAVDVARRRWRCHYCKAVGTWEELHQIECAYVYPPCSICGQAPECAEDCAGILAALGSPGVHVSGMKKPKLPEA